MNNIFLKTAKISLVLVYLVIIAGALVRMTGSGMGCPDWPKCFGYYIPPTEKSQLEFHPNQEYKKGMVIIKDEALWVAKKDFKTTQSYSSLDWEKYTKHDYAVFNSLHTWVEYINRLFGALAGIACFTTFVLSFWQKNKWFVFSSFLICVLMGFQAWLGKTVVDSVLNPYKITTHMLVAFVIVAFQLYLIHKASNSQTIFKKDSKFSITLYLTIILTIIQVILGTSVRETVDHAVDLGLPKESWLQNPTMSFYFHRSFSIIVLLSNLYLLLRNKNLQLGFKKVNWVMRLIFLEIITGILMSYVDFPFGSQTVHIVLASLLFGVQFYLVLENREVVK